MELADTQIESLEADIQRYKSDVVRLKQEIAAHHAGITERKKNVQSAVKERDEQRGVSLKTRADHSVSITALQEAIAVLMEQAHGHPQADVPTCRRQRRARRKPLS